MSPWDPLPLRPSEWLRIAPTCVEVERLQTGDSSMSGDSYAHVIYWGGELCVVAGQDAVDEARERGEPWVWVRILFSVRKVA